MMTSAIDGISLPHPNLPVPPQISIKKSQTSKLFRSEGHNQQANHRKYRHADDNESIGEEETYHSSTLASKSDDSLENL